MGMTLWLISMAIFIVLFNGVFKYIVTVINRTKGMSMTRLPLTIWAFFVTAIMGCFVSSITVCGFIVNF
jgi:cytochrome c oxidase subunit 1